MVNNRVRYTILTHISEVVLFPVSPDGGYPLQSLPKLGVNRTARDRLNTLELPSRGNVVPEQGGGESSWCKT